MMPRYEAGISPFLCCPPPGSFPSGFSNGPDSNNFSTEFGSQDQGPKRKFLQEEERVERAVTKDGL
jgi:hypothetical protein